MRALTPTLDIARMKGLTVSKQKMELNGERKLRDLISVGPAIRRDFAMLCITTVAQLAKHEPEALYRKLCRKLGTQQDICVLDTFRAAVAQARNPRLPVEQCVWWYWSRVRRAQSR